MYIKYKVVIYDDDHKNNQNINSLDDLLINKLVTKIENKLIKILINEKIDKIQQKIKSKINNKFNINDLNPISDSSDSDDDILNSDSDDIIFENFETKE